MKKSLFLSTLLTAAALSVPAFATDYDFTNGSGIELDPSSYTSEDTITFGDSSGSFTEAGTFAANIVINSGGLTIGGSAADYTFSGTISGSGDWTTSVANNYTFTGDISGWTGTLNGSGTATFDSTSSTQTINANLNIEKMVFAGTANYVVNGTVIGYLHSGTQDNTITITTTGSVTFNTTTTMTQIGVFTVDAGSTVVFGNTCELDLTGNQSQYGMFVSGTLEVAEGKTLTVNKAQNATVSIANLKLDNGSNFTIEDAGANTITLSSVTVADNGSAKIAVGVSGANNSQDKVAISSLTGTNATLTLDSAAQTNNASIFELGGNSTSTTFTGKITLTDDATGTKRGMTLVISDAYIAAGAVIEMGSEADASDTLALGVNASTVEIAGLVSADNHTGADIVYSGTVSLGSALGSGGENLIAGSLSGMNTSRNTLAINTATGQSYEFNGTVLKMLNLEKSGAGKQTINFESGSSFDGSIAVKAGTLALSGEAISSTGLTVAADATLTIGNSVSLAATEDVTSVSSTISGTLSIAEGGSLALDGTVAINNAISNSGSITIASTATITVGVEQQTYTTGEAYYVLITGGDGASVTFNGDISSFTGITFEGEWNVYTTGGYLVIYGTAAEATGGETSNNLIWNGTDGNNTWTTSADVTNWVDAESGDSNYYFSRGAAVTFNGTAGNKSVVLGENITAGNVTFTEGGYTVSGDFSLTAGTLAAQHVDGSTVTIAVTELDVTSITMGNNGNDNLRDEYKHLVIGDGTTATTAKAESMSILGQSEIDIAANSTLTVSGDASFGGGYSMAIGGEGTLTIGGTITFSSSHELEVSIASLQAANFSMTGGGAATFSGASSTITKTLTLGSASSSLTYTGEGTHTVTELLAHTTGTVTLDYSNLTGNLTIGTVDFGANGTLSVNGNANGTITTVSFTNTATLAISGTVNVGSVTAETSGAMANITIAEGATLNVSGAMTFHPGGFANGNYSTITGAGTDKSTVVTGSLVIGEGTAGAGVEIKNTTFITGGITFSDSTSSGMFYLYLDDVTLGFTKDVTIAAGGESNSAIELGDKSSSTETTDTPSTTVINTNKYVDGAFTDTGVAVTIAEMIAGTGTLEVTGNGSLTLSGENTYSGGTIIDAGKVIAANDSALGTGDVTISNGGQLSLGSDVSLNVAAMEIVLGTDTYTNGTYAITGDTGSSLSVATDAAIKITVDSALASLLGGSEEGTTYTFDIYSGLSLSEGVFDISDILGYGTATWDNGVLTVVVGSGAIPEPSAFGLFFGLGALGLVATRRRRRAA